MIMAPVAPTMMAVMAVVAVIVVDYIEYYRSNLSVSQSVRQFTNLSVTQ